MDYAAVHPPRTHGADDYGRSGGQGKRVLSHGHAGWSRPQWCGRGAAFLS